MIRATLLPILLCLPLAGQLAPPNDAGVTNGHVHIITADPAAQKRLWIDAMGGKLITAGPLEYAAFPGMLVGFRKGDSSGGSDGSVVNHLGFAVRDGAAVKARLRQAGAKITREAAAQFFALFPGDVLVEIVEDAKLDAPAKFHHIHFATDKVDEMRAWYARLFGAVPGMRGRFKAADIPGANLSWNQSDGPTAPTKGRALDHIGFEVKDIKAFCARLQAQGIKLDMPVTPRPDLGLTIAFVTDPWGTRVELTEGLRRD